MKIRIARVLPVDDNLRVVFPRSDWLQTPEGVRALRILRGRGRVLVNNRAALVLGAAQDRKINTVEACQRVMDKWANVKMGFEFFRTVGSGGDMFTNLKQVRAAHAAGRTVDAYLEGRAVLPILPQDHDAMERAGYGGFITHGGHPLFGIAFSASITPGHDPWKFLAKLQRDVVRRIK